MHVKKPVANSVEECRLMVEAARDSGRVVQTGQWQRSGPHYREARRIVRSGVLGDIRLIKTWAYRGWMKPVPVEPDGPAPDGVDYAIWLGPAPMPEHACPSARAVARAARAECPAAFVRDWISLRHQCDRRNAEKTSN